MGCEMQLDSRIPVCLGAGVFNLDTVVVRHYPVTAGRYLPEMGRLADGLVSDAKTELIARKIRSISESCTSEETK